MKKTLIFLIFILAKTLIFAQTDKNQIYKFNQVMDAVVKDYADSVDAEKLVEKAIISVLKELDPHSLYFSKDEIDDLDRGLRGNFVGVGITYDIINDTVLILGTVKNGPSDKAGIKPGDRIILIENDTVAGNGINDDKLRDLLSGAKGTKVKVSIKRIDTRKLLTFEITRDKIPVKSVTAAYSPNKNTIYIRLSRFSATTEKEIEKILDSLNSKNTDIILDLRYNSGGYLYTAIQVLEHFFPRNKLICYTEGANLKRKNYYTHKKGKYRNNNLAVLINEYSASASEIVAGAIQDSDRGIIIGRRSYGKGLVQKPYYLIDGSMIRLTVARYYTPSGRFIQKPYDKKNGFEKYENDLINRYEHGEFTDKDSIKQDKSLKYKTLKNKRTVYGGGGIMPDIFIPVDTINFPSCYREHFGTGKINEFIHLYVEKNRKQIIDKYKNFENFEKEYYVKNNLSAELADYLYKDDIKKNDYFNEFIENEYIKNHLKALIADDLWGNTEYYKIMNKKDEAVLKALEVLSNKKEYAEILKLEQ